MLKVDGRAVARLHGGVGGEAELQGPVGGQRPHPDEVAGPLVLGKGVPVAVGAVAGTWEGKEGEREMGGRTRRDF